MTGTNTELTTTVETYFADLGLERASGDATEEPSSYGPLVEPAERRGCGTQAEDVLRRRRQANG